MHLTPENVLRYSPLATRRHPFFECHKSQLHGKNYIKSVWYGTVWYVSYRYAALPLRNALRSHSGKTNACLHIRVCFEGLATVRRRYLSVMQLQNMAKLNAKQS